MIDKSFIEYFKEIVNKLNKIPISNYNQKILIEENYISINDDIIIVQLIKTAIFKRSDMKSELKFNENIAIVITEQLIKL